MTRKRGSLGKELWGILFGALLAVVTVHTVLDYAHRELPHPAPAVTNPTSLPSPIGR